MTQHYNHLQPKGDPYNLGRWIETVPHAYDPTLQPEISLTRDLISRLFELATAPTGQELPATVNDRLSACLHSASTTLSKLQRTESKIASNHPLHGKNAQLSHSFDNQEDFDSLSDEEMVEYIGFLIQNGSHLDLAHEIALARVRLEQDMARWRQGPEPKEAVKIARGLLRGVNTVCRLFNDQLTPVSTTTGSRFDAIIGPALDELHAEWGTDVF